MCSQSQRAASSETRRLSMRAEQESIKLPVWSVRRVCLSCYDVSEAVSALARRRCQANAPSLCRLCEVKPPFSVTPPTSTTHTPITTDRPHISERVFHLYGSVCALPGALILRARLPLPGATTRGPRAALSPGCYSSPASLSARAAHRSISIRAIYTWHRYHGTLLRDLILGGRCPRGHRGCSHCDGIGLQ
jgi:hypothetical protein